VGYDHEDAAWTVNGLKADAHHVLLALAHAACVNCGVTWLGVATISLRTGIGATRIRQMLAELVAADHVRIFRYPKGGRGRSTEYVVLPQLVKLSTPLCGKCVGNQKTHRTGDGYSGEGVSNTHRTGDGYSEKPTAAEAKTHRTSGGQPVSESQPVSGTAASGAPEAVASPPVSSTTLSPSENVARARELIASLTTRKAP
jgi:hypothetical protein